MSYEVWTLGRLSNGRKQADVRAALVSHFKLPHAEAARLSTQRCRVKRCDTAEQAERYARILRQLGVEAEVQQKAAAAGAAARDSTTSTVSGLDTRSIQRALKQAIPRSRTSPAFAISLLFTALMTLIAPLLYIAIVVALIGSLIGWYIYLPTVLASTNSLFATVTACVAPVVLLGLPILFVLRPLFARYPKQFEFAIKRKQAPLLFDLVERLCAAMGLAAPTAIVVNTDVNAAASADGIAGLIRGERKLIIGLPLIAGLDVTQLAGILAHEFGHFTQRFATLTYTMIGHVNGWFHSRAYQQDSLEDRIEDWIDSETGDFALVGIPLWLASQLIGLIKLLFRGLYHLNNGITLAMSRQMEYDADSYEAYLTGSAGFATNSLMINRLMEAGNSVWQTNRSGWRDEKLIADIPAAVAVACNEQTRSQIDRIADLMNSREASPWDSHPPDQRRIARANKLGHKGQLLLDYPASDLILDFAELCHHVTLFEYRQRGIRNPERYTQEHAAVRQHQQQRQIEESAAEAYFDGDLHRRLLQLSPAAHQQPTMDWQAAIDRLSELKAAYQERNQRYISAEQRYGELLLAGRCVRERLDFGRLPCGYSANSATDLSTETTNTRSTLEQVQVKTDSLDRLLLHRMRFAIDHMSGATQQRSERLLNCLAQFRKRCHTPLRELRYQRIGLHYSNFYQQDRDAPDAVKRIATQYTADATSALRGLVISLDLIDNPIDADAGTSHLGDIIRRRWGQLPDVDATLTAGTVLGYCESLLAEFWHLYFRLLGELCALCLDAEKANGITPLRITFGQRG